jgi:hypothetical protein
MLGFFQKDLADEMQAARITQTKRKSRLRVQVGQAVYPVLRMWHDGLALDAALTPHLRGVVDVYDGANHIFHCLIVASTTDRGELICEFKQATAVRDRAPLDFWKDENAPVGYLPAR